MRIALDYDGTYTADPGMWNTFIELARLRGHEIFIVTMRYPTEPVSPLPMDIEVIYTSRQAKARHAQADIWIDDNPQFVFGGSGY